MDIQCKSYIFKGGQLSFPEPQHSSSWAQGSGSELGMRDPRPVFVSEVQSENTFFFSPVMFIATEVWWGCQAESRSQDAFLT